MSNTTPPSGFSGRRAPAQTSSNAPQNSNQANEKHTPVRTVGRWVANIAVLSIGGGVFLLGAGALAKAYQPLPRNTYEEDARQCFDEDTPSDDDFKRAVENGSKSLPEIMDTWNAEFLAGGEAPYERDLNELWASASGDKPMVFVEVDQNGVSINNPKDKGDKRLRATATVYGELHGAKYGPGIKGASADFAIAPYKTTILTPIAMCQPAEVNRDVYPVDMMKQTFSNAYLSRDGVTWEERPQRDDFSGFSNPLPLPAGNSKMSAGSNIQAYVITLGPGSTANEMLPVSAGGIIPIRTFDGSRWMENGEVSPWAYVVRKGEYLWLDNSGRAVEARRSTEDDLLKELVNEYSDATFLGQISDLSNQLSNGTMQLDDQTSFRENTVQPKHDLSGGEVSSLPAPRNGNRYDLVVTTTSGPLF